MKNESRDKESSVFESHRKNGLPAARQGLPGCMAAVSGGKPTVPCETIPPGSHRNILRVPSHLLFCIVLFSLIAGCAASRPHGDPEKEIIQDIPSDFFTPSFPTNTLLIEPGDMLTVRFYYHPELNSTQSVRPDGKVSLTLFQGVDAAGQTPEQFQSHLVQLYSREFVNPVVTVEIEKKASLSVFVSGQVNNGGSKPLQSNTTIGQMLAQCGVRERDASLSSVVLVRRHSDTLYKAYRLDARLENGHDRDVYLAQGDVIIVPRNVVTIIGDFVQKYIRDIVPPQMNISGGISADLTRSVLQVK